MSVQPKDYLQWRSKLSLEQVFASAEPMAYPTALVNSESLEYLYLTSLSQEKNRSVLMHCCGEQSKCITPEGYSLRSKINEYGGKPFWLLDDELIFVNQNDQCLYRQQFEGNGFSEPARISVRPDDSNTFMYSDVHKVECDQYLAIVEQHKNGEDASLNRCFIGLVDASKPDAPVTALRTGADFYSNFVFDKTQQRVAWVQWSHPNMPWDANRLFTATVDDGAFSNIQEIVARPDLLGASYCQLCFANNGVLFYSVDFSTPEAANSGLNQLGADDYWNVYAWDPSTQESLTVTAEHCEFGYPHWQYGDVRITQFDETSLLAIGSHAEQDVLFLIDQNDYSARAVYQAQSSIQSLSGGQSGHALAIELSNKENPALVDFSLVDGGVHKQTLNAGAAYSLPVSIANAMTFDTRDGRQAHGFYYPPISHQSNNEVNELADDVLPPLLVMVHGGPTARAYGYFDIQKQFWLSNGFAILDVNHRGSTGYGRRFRDSLYSQWGQLDAVDIIDGIRSLIDQGLVDEKRICIRGKSAGGYAVLRAMTQYPSVFKAGACYYGIGNLATLAEVTHKFEKHYTDRLIGEKYDKSFAQTGESKFYTRSPINDIERIESAMIVFQGGQDKVVPPEVAHEVVQQLADKCVPHEYIEYPDEGHGFRQAENNIDAWSKELTFYRTHLG